MTGIELIAKERRRQVEAEGWDADHDAQHDAGELACAAAAYAVYPKRAFVVKNRDAIEDVWPGWWDACWDKRHLHSPIRRLVIAGL